MCRPMNYAAPDTSPLVRREFWTAASNNRAIITKW